MTNNSPFDDNIKKQFGNYKPEVPPHIWENIVAQKEQRKPGGFLFNLRGKRFTLILLLLIATGAGALLVHNIYKNNKGKNDLAGEQSLTKKTTINGQGNIPNEIKKANKEVTGNLKDGSISSISTVPVQNAHSNIDQAVEKNSNADQQRLPATGNEKAVVSTIATRLNNAHNKNADTKTADGILSKRTTSDDVKKQEPRHGSATDINTGVTDNGLVSTKNKIKRSAGKSLVAIQAPGTEVPASIQHISTTDATTTTTNANEVPVENRYLDLNKTEEKTFSFSVKNINLPQLNIPCPGGKNGNGKKYLEIYGGPDYAFRSFNDTANSTYLQKRKESTKVSSAFSFGLRYTKVFNNGISFRTGINYSQVNEKFKFEQGHIVQLAYIIDSNGDTTGSYATTGTRYKTTHNRYKTIDIPLLVGYEVGNKRFRANFNAGLIVNAYSWQRGDVLDSAYQPVNITTGKSSSAYQFKTNVGLGITGGVSLYYRLTGKMYFLAEPYFRYNFSAANKADITLKQKYTTLGLRLGLRIDF